MAQEIERKFLVTGSGWKRDVERSLRIRQSYLALTESVSIRIRIVDGRAAWLTIKSAAQRMARIEFEYPLPLADAEELMGLGTGRLVTKRRHIVPIGPARWEVDVFEGERAGLVLAELELPSVSARFERPDWLGEEVTGDPAYYNSNLATRLAQGAAHSGALPAADKLRRLLVEIPAGSASAVVPE